MVYFSIERWRLQIIENFQHAKGFDYLEKKESLHNRISRTLDLKIPFAYDSGNVIRNNYGKKSKRRLCSSAKT